MRDHNKGSRAPENGHTFKHRILEEIRKHSPSAVVVAEDKISQFWNKLPLKRGELPLCGVELQIVNGRTWDVFFACPDAFPNGLLVETKWQESSGSAHEKLTHAMFRAHDASLQMRMPTVLVIGGAAFEAGPGYATAMQCLTWRAQYKLKTDLLRSPRDFTNWFGMAIRRKTAA